MISMYWAWVVLAIVQLVILLRRKAYNALLAFGILVALCVLFTLSIEHIPRGYSHYLLAFFKTPH
jgi:hypothetical protein